MITYACVLRSGGIYTPEWVRKLSRAVGFHATRPHRFVCLSDVDVPCERIELTEGLPGWYAKLELFRPGLFDDPVVYLDLDTLVIGDLTPLEAIADGPLAMLSDFYRPAMAASGVMAWSGDVGLWDKRPAVTNARKRLDLWLDAQGDVRRIQDLVPGVYSFKAHCKAGPREDAMLVCGHGRPRFDDAKAGWAHQWWAAL